MADLQQQILRTDAAGIPLEWIDYRNAVRLYFLDQVAYSCGQVLYRIHGGINAITRQRSIVEVNTIIATYGNSQVMDKMRRDYTPPLNNHTLFQRDGYLCMYCGEHYLKRQLSRDHVTPLSKGGPNHWNNVVTPPRTAGSNSGGNSAWDSSLDWLPKMDSAGISMRPTARAIPWIRATAAESISTTSTTS
nr:HNH endonuclease [Solemya velesiana gill symbiont]